VSRRVGADRRRIESCAFLRASLDTRFALLGMTLLGMTLLGMTLLETTLLGMTALETTLLGMTLLGMTAIVTPSRRR